MPELSFLVDVPTASYHVHCLVESFLVRDETISPTKILPQPGPECFDLRVCLKTGSIWKFKDFLILDALVDSMLCSEKCHEAREYRLSLLLMSIIPTPTKTKCSEPCMRL